ncbi:hypothetical protein A2U01_0103395, partial [Trifolium medium]|nr:hypothetical protein [Trifolium medium]
NHISGIRAWFVFGLVKMEEEGEDGRRRR